MTKEKNSLLNPVGKASPMPGTPAWTMAIFEANTVPEGTELFVQPKDSRLTLEIQVANDNALHWHTAYKNLAERHSQLRQSHSFLKEEHRITCIIKNKAMFLLGQVTGKGLLDQELSDALSILLKEAAQ